MSFISRLFNSNDSQKSNSLGSIQFDSSKIVCRDFKNESNNFEVQIDDIEYIYITKTEHQTASLMIYQDGQKFLPANFESFNEVCVYLGEKFNFIKKIDFHQIISNNITVRKEIYRRKVSQNFEILNNDNYNDSHLGFEIQSPDKEFVSWDLTLNQMLGNKNLINGILDFAPEYKKFKYPVRIGNIILQDFNFRKNASRNDVPVLSFFSDCYNTESNDESYFDLKKNLINSLGSNDDFWEREDQNHYTFNANEILISLVYWYDTTYGFESGYTSFGISNYREYPDLLINIDYENKISVNQFLVFDELFRINADYKHNPKVKRISEKIFDLFSKKSVIWIDELNKKIGFADDNQSQVFDINEIKNIAIQNISPARSNGCCYLELNLKNNATVTSLFEGDYKQLDKYAIEIEKISSKKVIFNQEFNDC